MSVELLRALPAAALSALPEHSLLAPVRRALPSDLHLASVYLASLSEGSRRTMRAALENMAKLVSAGRSGAFALPWQELRYQHTAAIRSALAERYAPATANKMLPALRGVLKECRRLQRFSQRLSDRVAAVAEPAARVLGRDRVERPPYRPDERLLRARLLPPKQRLEL